MATLEYTRVNWRDGTDAKTTPINASNLNKMDSEINSIVAQVNTNTTNIGTVSTKANTNESNISTISPKVTSLESKMGTGSISVGSGTVVDGINTLGNNLNNKTVVVPTTKHSGFRTGGFTKVGNMIFFNAFIYVSTMTKGTLTEICKVPTEYNPFISGQVGEVVALSASGYYTNMAAGSKQTPTSFVYSNSEECSILLSLPSDYSETYCVVSGAWIGK